MFGWKYGLTTMNNSPPHNQNILLILLLQFLIIYPSATPRELLFEEESRLGSRPPSCHNKCNQCHPCMAVQVPTLPGQSRVDSVQSQTRPGSDDGDELGLLDSSMGGNRYSNYKPLGWKCQCKDHFFNP